MLHHLRGKLVETGPMRVVVEVGGVGYDVLVPLSTLEALAGHAEVHLYTHLLVREENIRLYGFSSRAEREVFALILSVSGVGPSLALTALSAFSVDELTGALAAGDAVAVQKIKGVGKRLAERLVVELKDKVGELEFARSFSSARGTRADVGDVRLATDPRVTDAVSALIALGFQRKDAEERVTTSCRRLQQSVGKDQRELSVEALIREALN